MAKRQANMNPLSFCADAATVVALRTFKIVRGGSVGAAEAQLMVSEKLAALAYVQLQIFTGRYGKSVSSIARGVARHYAHGVRANRRRLTARK